MRVRNRAELDAFLEKASPQVKAALPKAMAEAGKPKDDPWHNYVPSQRQFDPPRQKPAIRVPKDHENIPVSPLSNPVVKRQPRPPLAAGIQREAEGFQRTVVRFTGFYVRPLDPDNFAGSIKDLLDGLRHAGLIPGDEWWQIRLETDQVKVATKKEERTEIVIVTPELNKP